MGGEISESLMIPCLEFSGDELEFKEGSEGWKEMCKRVKEACENHGCFLLIYDRVLNKGLRDDMFLCIKELFDLPEETKRKHTSLKPYRSYSCDCPVVPLCQSFGIDDAPLPKTAHAFTSLMWPQGNPTFWYLISSLLIIIYYFSYI